MLCVELLKLVKRSHSDKTYLSSSPNKIVASYNARLSAFFFNQFDLYVYINKEMNNISINPKHPHCTNDKGLSNNSSAIDVIIP